jgi:stearoyl-CoA desaturase (delta-9 desaturase)
MKDKLKFEDIHPMMQLNILATMQIVIPLLTIGYFVFVDFNIIMFAAAMLLGYLWAAFGTVIGYHRIFCHKLVKVSNKWKVAFNIGGAISQHLTPTVYSMSHTQHHMFTDTPKDPHSPRQRGLKAMLYFDHAHVMDKQTLTPREKLKTMVAHKDLMKDPIHQWFGRNMYYVIGAYVLLCAAVGAFFGSTLAGIVYGYFITFCYTHVLAQPLIILNHLDWMQGKRPYKNNFASNKYLGWPLIFLEHNHADHHEHPDGRDWTGRLIKRFFDGNKPVLQ